MFILKEKMLAFGACQLSSNTADYEFMLLDSRELTEANVGNIQGIHLNSQDSLGMGVVTTGVFLLLKVAKQSWITTC